MTSGIVIMAIGLTLVAAALFATARLTAHAAPRPGKHTSPIDHAERILAYRYARGLIDTEEYARMLAVLRR